MVQSNPLRLSLELVSRETGFSYLSRLAARNGISASDFCADQNLSLQSALDGEFQTIKEIAWLGGISTETLAAWSPEKQARQHELAGEWFPGKVIRNPTVRGCPMCLKEDATASLSHPNWHMAIKGDWLVPHVTLCIEHEHPLVPLWYEKHPFRRYDVSAQMKTITASVLAGRFDQETRMSTDFDEWISDRLSGIKGESWLDTQDLHASATFCFLLGCSLLRHEGPIPVPLVKNDSHWGLYQMGYEVAVNGVNAIHIALKGLLDLDIENQQGPKTTFPVLYDRLSRDYADAPRFEPFRQILREHLLDHWPLGIGDDLLGEPIVERRLHSVLTAARETGIDQRRLRKVLESEGLLTGGRPDKWAVFDAVAAKPLLASIVTYLPATSFAELLGMSRSHFEHLVADGCLKPSLNDGETKNIWDPRIGRDFLDSILAGAEPLRQAQHGWEHISKSAQRLKLPLGDLVKAIQQGRIKRIGNHIGFDGFKGIHVYHDQVITALGGDTPNAMTLEVFSKSVGIGQPSRFNRLVKYGVTPSTILQNPRTKAMQPYITKSDAEAFHQKFYTLRTLANATGRS